MGQITKPVVTPPVKRAPTIASLDAKLDQALDLLKAATVHPSTVPTPAPKPVYVAQPTMALLAAGFAPVNYLHPSFYNSRPEVGPPGPDDTSFTRIPAGNVRHIARLTVTGGIIPFWAGPPGPDAAMFAGAPAFFEFGGQYLPETADALAAHVLTARAAAPTTRFGLTEVPCTAEIDMDVWGRATPPPAAAVEAFKRSLDPYRKLLAACDTVSGGCYVDTEATFERDLRATKRRIEVVRAEFPGKPCYFWIRTSYTFGTDDGPPLTADHARRLLAMAQEYDGAIVWSASPEQTLKVFGPLIH